MRIVRVKSCEKALTVFPGFNALHFIDKKIEGLIIVQLIRVCPHKLRQDNMVSDEIELRKFLIDIEGLLRPDTRFAID